ncbi:hypothetical protein PIB30_098620, partial [Stylosanthes scabra]|nr:hypothetical protein [Stylosanthes scabra]
VAGVAIASEWNGLSYPTESCRHVSSCSGDGGYRFGQGHICNTGGGKAICEAVLGSTTQVLLIIHRGSGVHGARRRGGWSKRGGLNDDAADSYTNDDMYGVDDNVRADNGNTMWLRRHIGRCEHGMGSPIIRSKSNQSNYIGSVSDG